MQLLLDAIAARYGHDLRGYRPASLHRRIRHALTRSGAANLGELQHLLLHDRDLFASVLDDLTVQVSDMFRDPEVYRTIRNEIVPLLYTYPQVRIWHAGCSSGEEVYTTAILLAEEGLRDRSQIYATDLSEQALARARDGVYAAHRGETFAANHAASGGKTAFDSYVSVAYDHLALADSLRKNVVFFQHDLVSDQAFGQMQVVFCRNVLIYFDRELRLKVLEKLAEGLCRGGFLILGTSEQLGKFEERLGFVEFDGAARIYRYRGKS